MKTLLNPSPAGILLSGLIFFSPPSLALELSGKGGGEIFNILALLNTLAFR
ncbi:MAG: hypothetical protein L3J38_00790 [Thiomicrorhabdus sp.]|nr:hypothetical protein [Thiomicrorhabdus sp.]